MSFMSVDPNPSIEIHMVLYLYDKLGSDKKIYLKAHDDVFDVLNIYSFDSKILEAYLECQCGDKKSYLARFVKTKLKNKKMSSWILHSI